MSMFKNRSTRGLFFAPERKSSSSSSANSSDANYSDDFESLSSSDLGGGDSYRHYYRTEQTLTPSSESLTPSPKSLDSADTGSLRDQSPLTAAQIKLVPNAPRTPTCSMSRTPESPESPKGPRPNTPNTRKSVYDRDLLPANTAYPRTPPILQRLTPQSTAISPCFTPQPQKGSPLRPRSKSLDTTKAGYVRDPLPAKATHTRTIPLGQQLALQTPNLLTMPQLPRGPAPLPWSPLPRDLRLNLGDLSSLSQDDLAARKQPKPAKKQKKGRKSTKNKKAKGKGPRINDHDVTDQVQISTSSLKASDRSTEPEDALAYVRKMKKRVTLR